MQSVFLDGLMIILLVGVIVFSYQLNSQLKQLRKTGGDLTPTIKNLSSLITQSQKHIELIKSTSEEVNRSLEISIPQAQSLRDDLVLLIERSDKTDSLLEDLNSLARKLQVDVNHTAVQAKEIHVTTSKNLEKIKLDSQRLQNLKNTEVFRPILQKKGPAFEQQETYERQRFIESKETYDRLDEQEDHGYQALVQRAATRQLVKKDVLEKTPFKPHEERDNAPKYDTSELLKSLKSLR